jgi:hypothetical protein
VPPPTSVDVDKWVFYSYVRRLVATCVPRRRRGDGPCVAPRKPPVGGRVPATQTRKRNREKSERKIAKKRKRKKKEKKEREKRKRKKKEKKEREKRKRKKKEREQR